jgi:hypothetical protein
MIPIPHNGAQRWMNFSCSFVNGFHVLSGAHERIQILCTIRWSRGQLGLL